MGHNPKHTNYPNDWHPAWIKTTAAYILESRILNDPDCRNLRRKLHGLRILIAELERNGPYSRNTHMFLVESLRQRGREICDAHKHDEYLTYLENTVASMIRIYMRSVESE